MKPYGSGIEEGFDLLAIGFRVWDIRLGQGSVRVDIGVPFFGV